MAHMDPEKWYLPGWRIEQHYSPGVLIGNWSEDRHVFKNGNTQHNSTYRHGFRNFGVLIPENTLRRSNQLRREGIGPKYLYNHHGSRYSNNLVSLYDEYFNGRWRENTLANTRQWNGHKLSWGPEKSDFPLQGSGTKFGLYDKLQTKWKKEEEIERLGDYASTYTVSYNPPPSSGLVTMRCANPVDNSTTLNKCNLINKDLVLRNTAPIRLAEKLSLPMTNVSC